MILIVLGCDNPEQRNTQASEVLLSNDEDSIGHMYCFSQIKDSLEKTGILNLSNDEIIYDEIAKDDLLNDKKIESLADQVNEFYEFTFFTVAYKLKYKNQQYLIMIGQAAGATGLGVDYWNYRLYSLDSDVVIPEFSSLVKTPLSFFFNNKGELGYFQFEHSYQRTTNGSTIEHKSIPLLVHIFENNKEFTIEYRCNSTYLNME